MSQNERFPNLSIETAPAPVRETLRASAQKFGFLASSLARGAHAPALLGQVLSGLRAFEQTSLGELEREVLALTVAYEQGCAYCMALHSMLLSRDPAHADLLAALRAGTALADARLEALRGFVREVLLERGHVSAAAWRRFEQAGFTAAQGLEVVLGVGAYVMSTLLNIVTEAPLDSAFARFAWSRPQAA
jgi:AhpD family alkylhydroperoxidase